MSATTTGDLAVRPESFPEELWRLVDPKERPLVEDRFRKFVNKEYLTECVNKILNDLDICESDFKSRLPWKDQLSEGEEDEWE
jgi:hypothetical protein